MSWTEEQVELGKELILFLSSQEEPFSEAVNAEVRERLKANGLADFDLVDIGKFLVRKPDTEAVEAMKRLAEALRRRNEG